MDKVILVGPRILVLKDEDKGKTKGGIILPDDVKIPVLTGRVLALSSFFDDIDFPVKEFDKVLVDPNRVIPVSFEKGNNQFIVPAEDILAVFKREASL